MSESSKSFGSAKDDDFEKPETSSDDEPLAKAKKSPGRKPKAASKSPKKAGRPPGRPGRKPAVKESPAKNAAKRGRGRPAAANTPKSKKVEKPAKSSKSSPSGDPLELSDVDPLNDESEPENEDEYEVEAIVGHREYNGKLHYKIRWKNYDPKYDTWEDYHSLACPDLLESYNFRNKVTVQKYIMKKQKAGKRGRPKKIVKKAKKARKSSISEESEEASLGDSDICDDGEGDEYEVDKIVDVRNKKDGTREFRVHWKRWSSDYDTWEPEENLSCAELIEKFMNKVEEAKTSTAKELRVERKHTDRFTLSTHDSGRRLSKRNGQKQRVRYDGADSDEDD